MHLGLVGLGKMGFNMRKRLRAAGHTVTGYDANPDVSDVGSLSELVQELPTPRNVWVMVPAGEVTSYVISELKSLLSPGDLVVAGGNSRYTADCRHAGGLAEAGGKVVVVGGAGGGGGMEGGEDS